MRTRGVATALAVAAGALMYADLAEAQGRQARVRTRSVVVVSAGGYYAPRFYDPFYDPWFYPYGWGYPPYYRYAQRYYDGGASLRLQVMPRETEVYIDGYYAGTVDDFDGVFQRLHALPGEHELQLFLPGHRTSTQKIYLQPGSTFRVRHTMEPLGAGEPEPTRPEAPAGPAAGASPRAAPPGARPLPGRPGVTSRDGAYGTLAIRVQPGDASITIDGEAWERSADAERLIVQLAAGPHRIEVRKEGYRAYITEVTIHGDRTETLNVALSSQ